MASIEHCLFCFATLDAELSKRPALSLDDVFASYAEYAARAAGTSGTSPPNQNKNQPGPSPLFVTWNTDRGASEPGEYILRGCIGTFEAQPLAHGIATYALTAALHDTRFRPIALRELPHLAVAVTLLTDFEPAADALDWQLGTHGLRISFASASGRQHYGATYLPDVAPEQGWTKVETVASLMRKAGWSPRRSSGADAADGDAAPWTQVASFETVRYQGAKKSVSYAEYKAWRDWADAK